MDKVLSVSAKTEISNKVMDILRAYHIPNRHSELHNKNTYVHFNYLSRKRKLDKLYNEV